MATSLRLAFLLIFYSDDSCTTYHQGNEADSTFSVAIVVSGAYDSSQPNVTVFPATCSSGLYKTYFNTDPSYLPEIEVPGDLDTIYFVGDSLELRNDIDCQYVNNDGLFQPYSGSPETGPFYIKTRVPDNDAYSGYCPSSAPTQSPTSAPTSGFKYDDTHGFVFVVTMLTVFSVVGAVLIVSIWTS